LTGKINQNGSKLVVNN